MTLWFALFVLQTQLVAMRLPTSISTSVSLAYCWP
jgi:hypothetical protein